jgi:molybdopterin synthase sulfur carrier subunit
MPTIKVPPVLRPQTDGEAEVSVGGGTVGEVLRALAERYPETRNQLFSPEGELNRYVNIYLNDEDVRVLDGLDTGASDSDTVVILPAMAGGAEPARVRSASPRSG